MKLSTFALPALALGLATISSAQTAQPPTKVGIIHIQNAILGTKDGQKALQELEARSAPKKKELERRQGEILALQEQLNKSSNVGGEEAKQKLMRDIDQKKKAFSRDVDDAQADLDQENQKVLNELGGRIMAVLDKYSNDNGYALILDVSNQQTSPVLFAANGIDVTRDIIALYDKNSPGMTSVPTAKPAGAPPAAVRPTSAPPAATPKAAPPKPGTPK
ncbi:MAG: OmpH family outer membrane protein [Bryobacteraceae bacterium]